LKKIRIIVTFTFLLVHQFGRSQTLSFSHLNTSNGLSDNFTQSLVIDKSGFLWIGTTDGLNVYDGYTFTTWYKSSQTGLPSDTIRQLFCDSRNRIWAISPGQVAWSDEEKKFHTVQLPEKKERYNPFAVFEISGYGIVLFTKEGHYFFDENKHELKKIEWVTVLINSDELNTAVTFTKDKIIYIYEQRITVVDYHTQQKIYEKDIPHAVTACRYDDKTIAVATRHGEISLIDITTKQKIKIPK